MSTAPPPAAPASRTGEGDRVVRSLAVAVFVQWLGASAILPMLPVYLRRHGSSDALVGAVMAAFFVAGVLCQYPAGRLADRVGRRRVLLVGLVLYAAGSVAFLAGLGPWADVAFRALQGAGAGAAEVASLALVADAVPLDQRGRASSHIYGAVVAGLAVGPLVGSVAGPSHMALLFVASAGASLVACVPVLRAPVRERLAVAAGHGRLRDVVGSTPGRQLVQRAVVGALVASLALGLADGIYETCWTLLLRHQGATDWEVGLSWTLFAVPFVALARPGGWLADHLDRRWLAITSLAAAVAFCATYPFLGSVTLMLALGAAEAVCWAVAYPAAQSLLTEEVAAEHLGQAQGLFATAGTAATAVAAAAGGALFGLAPWVPFVATALVAGTVVATLPWIWAPVPGRVRVPATAGGT